MGKMHSFDFAVGGALQTVKTMFGEDLKKWADIPIWGNERWSNCTKTWRSMLV